MQRNQVRGLSVSAISSLVFGGILAAVPSLIRADIIIDGYSHATNDRFTNSGSFVMSGFDLSGVGQTDGGISPTDGRWATLISPNVVVSALHYAPSGTVYFYPGNDPNAAPVTRTVVSGVQVGDTDLWLGVLDSPVPSSIKFYSYATTPLSGTPGQLVSAGPYQGLNAYWFGKSPFDHNADPNDNRWSYNDQAVGRNLIDWYVENVTFGSYTDCDALLSLYGNNPFVTGSPAVQYECWLQGGDSGGPLFVDVGGQLVLLGTNAFIYSLNNGQFVGSGVNYIGNHAQFIADFIASVPEPGSAVLVLVLAGAALSRRRVA